jgi:membrane protease YdiL (CAAX protease family)
VTDAFVVAGLFVFACAEFFTSFGSADQPGSRTASLLLFTPLAACLLGLGIAPMQRALRGAISTSDRAAAGMALLAGSIAAYCLAAGIPIVPHTAAYVLYLFVPLAILRPARGTSSGARLETYRPARQILAAVVLWLPLSLGWLKLRLVGGFDASRLVAIVAALYLFLIVDPLDGMGYSFALRGRDWILAASAFLLFTVIAVPIGLGTGFLTWHPRPTADNVLALPVRIYLATAIPEEFLFRGIFQNLAVRALGFPAGLLLASIVFSLAHRPDLRYMLLAALAGVAYGWVYHRSGRVTASAITHAGVDWVWKLLFRR